MLKECLTPATIILYILAIIIIFGGGGANAQISLLTPFPSRTLVSEAKWETMAPALLVDHCGVSQSMGPWQGAASKASALQNPKFWGCREIPDSARQAAANSTVALMQPPHGGKNTEPAYGWH